MTIEALAARVRAGEPRALARALSVVEDETPQASALVGALYPHTGHGAIVGLTGAPGAGKSTLVDRLALGWCARQRRVAILAVDPTSPFTGGALLGDRVRMQHAGDGGVFIRSMATRGHLGGLARTTADAAIVLEAAGYDLVIVETVGVGQDEVEIVRTADVSLVVVVPGMGDDVQALKAGLMEIADIYVVNKADRDGADRAAAAIDGLLSLQPVAAEAWRPPVLRTEATSGAGVEAVIDATEAFLARTVPLVEARRRQRAAARVRDLVVRQVWGHLEREALGPGGFEALIDRVAAREIDAHAAARALTARLLEGR